MAYINIAGIVRHVPQFGGELWFVNKGSGSDSNNGTTPDSAFETIGAAITACAAGDAITIKAGTYTEDSILLNKNAVELWGEIGVVITPAGATTCLQVTGNSCRIRGIKTSKASQIGFDIDGAGCMLEDCEADDNTTAYDIDGAETTLVRCRDHNASVTGFDIATAENLLYLCSSIGNSTSRGFYLSHANADSNLLYQCVSTGNQTAGYEIITGCANNVLSYCVSGSNDGRWVDADNSTVGWDTFSFDTFLHKEFTLDSGGAGTFTENLFLVTGIVQIDYIYAEVEVAISADVDVVYLDLFPTGGAAIEITDNAGAVLDDIKAGSLISKQGVATDALVVEDSNLGFVSEQTGNYKSSLKPFTVGKKNGAVTHIRMVYDTGGSATGRVCWMVKWSPISDDGLLAVA